MSTPASISGHPIHSILVALPIGLWIFSFVSDVIYVTGLGAPVWSDVAFYTMAGGIVGALLAAVPGLIDLLALEEAKAKTIGIAHMVINLLVVAIYAANLWLRFGDKPGAPLPIAMSVVTVILFGISGWLGGELVFKHGVGVSRRSEVPPARDDRARAA